MKHMYSDDCLQCTAVFDWCKRFKEGRSSTEDLAHAGCPPHITDPDTRVKVDQMVQHDCCVMLRHISKHLGISMERVHHIITQVS
jgi:hypothetical protein